MDDASLEGILRPIIKEVVARYLDCGEERLLMFSWLS